MSKTEIKPNRFESVDQFKGLLVILMIVYHATILFDKNEGFDRAELVRDRLAFLHSAFLFLSGVLCGLYYYPKYKSGGSISYRVAWRGARLLVVFAICNFLAYVFFGRFESQNLIESLSSYDIFISSYIVSISGALFAFEVLAYIAIYLITAPLLFRLRILWIAIPGFLALAIVCESLTAQFLFIGAAGQLIGVLMHSRSKLNTNTEEAKSLTGNLCLVIVLVAYVLIRNTLMTESNSIVPKPIVMVGDSACCWCFSPFLFIFLPQFANWLLLTLGKYTLVAYLLQMPLIELILMFWTQSSTWLNYSCFVAFIFSLVILALKTIEVLRRRSTFLDSGYRKTFA